MTTQADAFAFSVILANQLRTQGLPVAGARLAGSSVAVGFNTPSGAVAVVTLPFEQATADDLADQRVKGVIGMAAGRDGFR